VRGGPGWQDEETEMLTELKQPPEVLLGLRLAARRLVRAGWAKAEARYALAAEREAAAAAETGWLSRTFSPSRPGWIFEVAAHPPTPPPPPSARAARENISA
jgi:hypothetical protein